jgi:hypothetical protein
MRKVVDTNFLQDEVLSDYTRVLSTFAREAAGASGTRHSLRPLFSKGEWFMHASGASRRENAKLCLRSERPKLFR